MGLSLGKYHWGKHLYLFTTYNTTHQVSTWYISPLVFNFWVKILFFACLVNISLEIRSFCELTILGKKYIFYFQIALKFLTEFLRKQCWFYFPLRRCMLKYILYLHFCQDLFQVQHYLEITIFLIGTIF